MGCSLLVKIVETRDVRSRRWETTYPCVLFIFHLKHDKNFMQKSEFIFDYMPTTVEILKFIGLAVNRIKGLDKQIMEILKNGK